MEILENMLSRKHPETATAMPATFAGRYLIECAVAGGAASVIWRAQELASGALVALKFFPPDLLQDTAVLASMQHVIHGARQCSHPGVVAPIEVAVAGKYAAVVTPWVEGPSLRQMLNTRRDRAFEVDELRPLFRSLLDAMESAHARGIVHGSLNSDLIFHQGGELRVAGWGVNALLRRAARRGRRASGRESGYRFLSPAQRRGEFPSASDDVYALGVLAHQLLTGALPRWRLWSHRPVALARQRRRSGFRGDEIPMTWDHAIRRCLDTRERERLGSVRELRLRLELGPMAAPAAAPAPRPPTVAPAAAPAPVSVGSASAPEAVPVVPASAPAMPPVAAAVPPADAATTAPGPAPSRPHLRGGIPFPMTGAERGAAAPASSPVAARADSPDPSRKPSLTPVSEPAPIAAWHRPKEPAAAASGVVMLRTVLVFISILTVAVGLWLIWQIAQRNEAFRAFVSEQRDRLSAMQGSEEPAGVEPDVFAGESPESEAPRLTSQDEPPHVRPEREKVAVSPVEDLPIAGLQGSSGADQEGAPTADPAAKEAAPDRDDAPEQRDGTGVVTSVEPGVESRDADAALGDGAAEVPAESDADGGEIRIEPEAPPMPEGGPLHVLHELAVVPAAGLPLEGGIFELGHVDIPPRLVDRVDPIVTRHQPSGVVPERVEVVVVIDRMGRVASATIQSATSDSLIEPSLEAARYWRFKPATKRGQVVAVRVVVPMTFESP